MTDLAIWAACALFVAGAACFTAHHIQAILESTSGRVWE